MPDSALLGTIESPSGVTAWSLPPPSSCAEHVYNFAFYIFKHLELSCSQSLPWMPGLSLPWSVGIVGVTSLCLNLPLSVCIISPPLSGFKCQVCVEASTAIFSALTILTASSVYPESTFSIQVFLLEIQPKKHLKETKTYFSGSVNKLKKQNSHDWVGNEMFVQRLMVEPEWRGQC